MHPTPHRDPHRSVPAVRRSPTKRASASSAAPPQSLPDTSPSTPSHHVYRSTAPEPAAMHPHRERPPATATHPSSPAPPAHRPPPAHVHRRPSPAPTPPQT